MKKKTILMVYRICLKCWTGLHPRKPPLALPGPAEICSVCGKKEAYYAMHETRRVKWYGA